MVSALDSRSSAPGSSPGQGTAMCSWGQGSFFSFLSQCLSSRVGCDGLASHPECVEMFLIAYARETRMR